MQPLKLPQLGPQQELGQEEREREWEQEQEQQKVSLRWTPRELQLLLQQRLQAKQL